LRKQTSALVLAGLVSFGLVFANNNQQAYAHMFSGDESASFLALAESIKTELQLVQSNLASNASLAEEHAAHAHEHLDNHTVGEIAERNERLARDLPAALEDLQLSLENSTAAEQVSAQVQNINDLLAETVTVRVDSEQLNNSTVWALVIANMADGVLEHYKAAYGIETNETSGGHAHSNESGSNMTHDDESVTMTVSTNETTTTEDDHGNMTRDDGANNNNNSTEVVNEVEYQTAQGLANRTIQLFNDQVRELAPDNATEAVADLEAGLQNLKQAIDNREMPTDVEVILNTEVHPNLQVAYNLQVAPEFPLPLLMILPAIAGIIAATRISALRRK
jgi:alpha-glucosidase (family GH31 glycosyl hydrolase)